MFLSSIKEALQDLEVTVTKEITEEVTTYKVEFDIDGDKS